MRFFSVVESLIIASAALQLIAVVIAFRLGQKYKAGWTWTPFVISLLLMAVYRLMRLYHLLQIDEEPIAVVGASLLSLAATVAVLAGVVAIERVFRENGQAQQLLRTEKVSL